MKYDQQQPSKNGRTQGMEKPQPVTPRIVTLMELPVYPAIIYLWRRRGQPIPPVPLDTGATALSHA
jgi:hypothetical protein